MSRNAQEQLMIELINRARLDPAAEAARYGLSDLNRGQTPGSITTGAKQALAGDAALESAATNHSLHMLAVDLFDHSGIGDGDIGSRADDAGYSWSGLGENISWSGTTGTPNLSNLILLQHRGLFLSDGHRGNILSEAFQEVGVAQEAGVFTNRGTDWNASMITQHFGTPSSSAFHITGVAYDDTNGDDFYSIGEGQSGDRVTVTGSASANTQSAGGYEIAVAANAGANGSVSVAYGNMTAALLKTGENIKVDFVNGNEIDTSASIVSMGGVATARLLGIDDLYAYGSGAGETLIGNRGNNLLDAGAGSDTLAGRDGNDTLGGSAGDDWLWGENGNDWLWGGADNDTLRGGWGVDALMGGSGNDALGGDGGNDFLDGGYDSDWLWGGAGADAFHFAGWGWHDFIQDFEDGTDRIDLSGAGWGYTSVADAGLSIVDDANGNAFISLGYNTWISVAGVGADQLTDADFTF